MAELSNNIGKLAQENEDGEDALNLVETESGAARRNRSAEDRRILNEAIANGATSFDFVEYRKLEAERLERERIEKLMKE